MKPKCSRAFLAESRIQASREVYERLRMEYPHVRDNYILQLITRQFSEMANADDVPTDQAVFGRSPRDVANLSLDDPISVRFTQNIP